MKEVGNRVRTLRGTQSLDDAAHKAKLSRETLRKIEAGVPIKLPTLRALHRALGGNHSDWLELECTWLQWHARADRDDITIEPRRKASKLRHTGTAEAQELTKRFTNLTTTEQKQILAAMDRPQVLRSITHLNELYESARKA